MKVLFVCTGNSFRSAVAEALLKKLRNDVNAESAGTHPARKIASNAKMLLEEDALENLKKRPEGIEKKNLEEYDLIVAMKERHKHEILQQFPQVKGKIQVWDIDDPIYLPNGSDREVLREIERRVAELAKSI